MGCERGSKENRRIVIGSKLYILPRTRRKGILRSPHDVDPNRGARVGRGDSSSAVLSRFPLSRLLQELLLKDLVFARATAAVTIRVQKGKFTPVRRAENMGRRRAWQDGWGF